MSANQTAVAAQAFITLIQEYNSLAADLAANAQEQAAATVAGISIEYLATEATALTAQQTAIKTELDVIMAANQTFTIAPAPSLQNALVSEFPTGIVPSPSIAPIPNFENVNTALSQSLAQYVTGPYTSLSINVMSGGPLAGSGWAFTSPNLTYTPGTVSTLALQLVVSNGIVNVTSNVFQVQSVSTALAAPVIATIPSFLNKSSSFSINLATYVTGTYSGLSIVGSLSAGWSFAGTTLSYSGTGVGSASVQLAAAWTGSPILSNAFGESSVSSVGADTVAPSVPVAVAAILAAVGVTLSFAPSSDSAEAGELSSGMSGYVIERNINGGAYSTLTTITSPDAGIAFAPVPQDIGSPPVAGSTVHTGASFTMSGYGAYWTVHQGQIAPFPITGNFICTFRVSSFTSSDNYAKTGAFAQAFIDPVNGPGSPYVLADVRPFAGGVGCNMDYNPTQGAVPNATTPVPNTSLNMYVMFQRVGNVFTMWASTNPDMLGTVATQVAQQTVVLPATVYVGPMCAGGTATSGVSAQIDQWNITQDAMITYQDMTAIALNTIYGYQVAAVDLASNDSAFSLPATVSTATGGAQTFMKFATGLPNGTTKRVMTGETGDIYATNPIDQMVGTTIANMTVTTTGKCPALYGFWFGLSGQGTSDATMLSLAQQHINNRGVAVFHCWPKNPQTGGPQNDTTNPFPSVLTPGSSNYNAFVAECNTYAANLNALRALCPNAMVPFRPLLEMNGNWFWWGTGNASTTQWVALWNIMRATFAAAGVTNALWVYSPNWGNGNYSGDGTGNGGYFPGTSGCDIVSMDIYPNGTPVVQTTTTTVYNALVAMGKPQIWCEMGASSGSGGGDVSQFIEAVKSNYPQVIGLIEWGQSQAYGSPGITGDVESMTDAWCVNRTDMPVLIN